VVDFLRTTFKRKIELSYSYGQSPKKATVFKTIYLTISAAVFAYAAYLLIDYIVYGFKEGVTFDDCVILISSVIELLFEGAVIGFIVRSYKAPTILMKNLVFKQDGTPYLAGIIIVLIGVLITAALSVVFFISAYFHQLIKLDARDQYFILSVGLTLFTNLLFTEIYFLTFRHESGSFAII